MGKEDHHDDEKEEKDWAATEENCFAAGEFCGETKDEKACAWACTKCGKHFGAFEKEHGLKAGTIKKSCAAGKAKHEAKHKKRRGGSGKKGGSGKRPQKGGSGKKPRKGKKGGKKPRKGKKGGKRPRKG